MIIVLDTTTRKLQAVMGAAAANYNCTVTVAYAETTASSFTEGIQPTTLAGLTVTDILAAPSVAATRRVVKAIMIYNNDTVTQTVTVYLDDNGTDYPLVKVTLGPGANWASDDQTGVNVGGGVTDGNKGDIVVGGSGATWNIRTDMPGGAVTLAKMADLATDRLIGRDTAGTGAPEAISVTGGIEFTGGGSLQVGAFSGDVSKTAGSSTLTITSDAVTYAKMQNVTETARVIGRRTTGAGDPEECSLSQVLDFVGSATQGDLLYRGASTWTRLGAGTSGQYLQTQGTGANPQWATVSGGGGGGSAFKNRLINGDFRVAQRDTSFTSVTLYANNNDAYVLDRWYILTDGNDVIDVTQSTDVPTAPGAINSIALDVETISKKFGIAQIIENRNCADLIGGTVSLSFKAKVSNTILSTIKATVISWTGTADSVNSTFITTGNWNTAGVTPFFATTNLTTHSITSFSPTTSWATYKIENISLSASAKNVIVFIWSDVLPSSTGHFLYITDVQLEAGATATAYERLPYDVQLRQCQRYFYSVSGASGFGGNAGERFFGGWGQGGTEALAYLALPVTYRIAPDKTAFPLKKRDTWRGYSIKENNNYSILDGTSNFRLLVTGVSTMSLVMFHSGTPAGLQGSVYFLFADSADAHLGFEGAEL